MAAKTTKENQHFLDMMDNSKFPEMGLIGAKLVDLEESRLDSNAAIMEKLNAIVASQTDYAKDIKANKSDIQENKKTAADNRDAITDIKIKDVKSVAIIGLVAAACTATGGIVVAVITGII